MSSIRPKKHLGQHFLTDMNIARKVAEALTGFGGYKKVLEVGPGTGALTRYLLERKEFEISVMEVDEESVEYLHKNFSQLGNRIYFKDFLHTDIATLMNEKFAVAGNFPYNISSQIVFKILENRNQVPEMTGMFQKEVAERLAEKPGTKTYGITSVLTQAFYNVEYLFTVNENVFNPPPKVKSAVIRLQRNDVQHLDCDEKLFVQVVKTCFNQRRKMIRNSIKALNTNNIDHPLFTKRPEQLGVEEFISLTKAITV
ncbi:MAG: 16S rRNA (adenine(1518)-N(6)/adenine(1519)-N(6))-dimethyltransferase RsmA [Bacteroidota bacterium]